MAGKPMSKRIYLSALIVNILIANGIIWLTVAGRIEWALYGMAAGIIVSALVRMADIE